MWHGEQFRTVSGSIRRLKLTLINLVTTLEITTKQLKNIILHILQQKQIRKKTKTQVFLLLHFCTINSRNVTSLLSREVTQCEEILFQASCQAVQRTFEWNSNCLCKSNINGTLSTWWPMFTSGKRSINLSFCRYLHMLQEDFFQPIFLLFYIGWEQRRKADGPHL